MNSILSEHRELQSDERKILFNRLAAVMVSRIHEGDARDYSRVAWLFLNLGDKDRACNYAREGWTLDSEDEHCARLAERLGLNN